MSLSQDNPMSRIAVLALLALAACGANGAPQAPATPGMSISATASMGVAHDGG